jgi:hypothetical protein
MTLTSDSLEIYMCALGTCEPNCTGGPVRLFFMFEARGPQETVGHVVVALKPFH